VFSSEKRTPKDELPPGLLLVKRRDKGNMHNMVVLLISIRLKPVLPNDPNL
jgi:hypothetical protein